MSASTYKSGLSASGLADKAKLQMRRPTPDSDAVASSDDDHDHVPSRQPPANVAPGGRRPSSGWLQDIQPNRKFSLPSVSFAGAGSNPTTPSLEHPQQQQSKQSTSAFPWNTSSFTSTQSGTRLKEVVPSPTSVQIDKQPLSFPTNNEADEGIGFLLNEQTPMRKSVRSQSYSIGQADIEGSAVGQFSSRLRSSLRHRPSKPSLLGDGLSQLREDEIDDMESNGSDNQGVRLPAGYWEREQKQALLKQAAVENARARQRAASAASPVAGASRKGSAIHTLTSADLAIDELDDHDPAMAPYYHPSLTRRFSEHGSSIARAGPPHVPHLADNSSWSVSPGAGASSYLGDNMARRHSFATYTSHHSGFQPPNVSYNEEDEDVQSPMQAAESPAPEQPELPFDASAYFTGYGPASRHLNASAISAAHPDPIVRREATGASGNPYSVPTTLGRPGRRLYVVVFKCSRSDIYYTYDNTGLEIRAGDLVITEGDRGCDLGQVSYADVSLDDAKRFKAEALDEHFRWLVMFSQYSLAGAKEPGMLGALARAHGFPGRTDHSTLTSMGGQQDQDTKPKMIKRLAQQHEIGALREKEGSEAKAKRMGAQKAVEHKLPMEILDAEFQADYHKLTFFYYAEHYVNFNPLVVDIFKQFKIRIWMSAVNPASVVNPAGLVQIQPPSAIAPGAILHRRQNPTAVGLGFGQGSYQHQDRRGGRQPMSSGTYYPSAFEHQLGAYTTQPQYGYGSAQYSTAQQYGNYAGYPASGYQQATGAGTPLNYGAYYPPATTYPTASYTSGAHRSTSGYGGQQYPTSSGSYSYAGSSAALDPALLSSFQAMNFNSGY